MRTSLIAASFAALVAASAAFAQQPQTVRVLGMITDVDGPVLVIKPREGDNVQVKVTDNVAVFGVVKATLADIKPGVFIGVGAMPMPDGSQRAIQIMIFADVQRGTGEGHRPWVRPGSTMTNATVETTVGSVDGQVIIVKYKDGDKVSEKKVIVPDDAVIRAYLVGSRDELKAGAYVNIVSAVKKPDGSLETARVNVGRDGIQPQ